MRAGFSPLIIFPAVCAAAAGCAAPAARKTPPQGAAAPVQEPPADVFQEDKSADLKSDAIDTLTRIIRWHNRRLVALGPEYRPRRLLKAPAKPAPPAVSRPAEPQTGPGAPATPSVEAPKRAAEAPPPKPAPPPSPAARPSPAPRAAATGRARRYWREELKLKKKQTAAYKCRRARQHAKAICRAAEKICRLADQLDEQPARERCAWARNQCRAARKRAGTVCSAG